ncbi:M43 family zinc metalloprotease [Streptomyces sp. NPDC002667]|uniref:zinc metalloprotease n=1 Tax=Streptomyces sp. NPDC002667 TaxID=3364657 RepID=UPI00367ABCAC
MSGSSGRWWSRTALAFVVATTCSTAVPAPTAGAVSASCVRPQRAGTAGSANVLGPAAAAAVERDFSRRAAAATATVTAPKRVPVNSPAHAKRVPVSVPVHTKRVPVSIPVYWHAIGKDTTVQGGSVPDSAVQEQIGVLNQAFSGTGLSFALAGIDRTLNPGWFDAPSGSPVRSDMARALRQGGPADLNVYSLGATSPEGRGPFGDAAFPWDYAQNPVADGIIVRPGTLPGGDQSDRALGKTAVRMVGHWAGLFHTFQGGCTDPDGDYVSDTPAEAYASTGCPENRDSCPGEGTDPIHNYMDMGLDSCATEFTPGQIARLQQMLRVYRGIEV